LTSSSNTRVLIVDDSVEMGRLLAERLATCGYATEFVSDGIKAVALIKKNLFDVIVTDLRMETVDGFDLLSEVRSTSPTSIVLIMTAFGSIETAVEAIKRGAYYYLAKPFQFSELRVLLERALDERRLRDENEALRRVAVERTSLGAMVGASTKMRGLFDLIDRIASSAASVLIRGESGTGKELVARAIHFRGTRRDRPFVAVNCTALPEQLLESELFGHLKGAFTGATAPRRGLFLEADGGTLFLDEIGDMAPPLQAKLLRVLEDGEVRAVGADSSRRVDVRIVAASHQDLERKVADGTFRADLFYRLKVVPLRIPPLRERSEDIPLLVEHFLAAARRRNPQTRLVSLSKELLTVLVKAAWPGNVRELEHLIERLVLIVDREIADVADLAMLDELERAQAPSPLLAAKDELVTLRQLEADYIDWVIARCNGNKSKAAEILGIDKSTIHRRERGTAG
jgi:two-component system response regulator HydG